MQAIGLIGYGAFGKAIVGWLGDVCEFTIYDKALPTSSVEAALSKPVVVLNIPAQFLESFLTEHRRLLPRDSLFVDVCSVKVQPVEVMRRLLPLGTGIIATHPLFGPQTAKQGVQGQKIMVADISTRNDEFDRFRTFLRSQGLRIIETSPEVHDQAMAYSQGLSHYIGRVMKQMNIPETELATQAYIDLLDMKRIQGNDSDALYSSIVHNNPYTKDVLRAFQSAGRAVADRFETPNNETPNK